MPENMDKVLRELHASAGDENAAHREALRLELQTRHRRLHPHRQRWKIMTHKVWFRPVLTSMAILILGIAACTTPTEYDVDLGKQLTMSFDGNAKTDDLDASLHEIVQYVESLAGVDKVMVNVSETIGGPLTAGVMVWGQGLDTASLQADLLARFPVLDTAELTISDLEGTVEGSVADAMGHALFDIEIDGDTAEEVRLQILDQLAAQGFTGDAEIQVIDGEDGERTVNIELNEIKIGDDLQADGDDQMIIELKQE